MSAPSVGQVLHVGRHVFVREFKLRYRRAFLGLVWAILPLALAGFMVVHVGARLGMAERAGAAPYVLQVFLGIVAMQSFIDALDAPQQLARRYAPLLATVAFPHQALLVASLGFVGFNLALRALFLAALFVYHGVAPAPTLPLALGCLAALVASGLALGALLAPVSLLAWDVRYGLPYLGMALYVATPVFYPVATDGLLGLVHQLNPLTHLLVATRVLALATPEAASWPVALGVAVATLPLAWVSLVHFRRAMLQACPHA